MFTSGDLGIIEKIAVVTYFNVMSRHSPGGSVRNIEITVSNNNRWRLFGSIEYHTGLRYYGLLL